MTRPAARDRGGRDATARLCGALLALALASGTAAANEPWWLGDGAARLAGDATIETGAVAVDGTVAISVARDPRGRRHELRISPRDGGSPDVLEVPGRLRGLAFDERGDVLYGVLFRPGKRRPPECYLLEISLDDLRARRTIGLPLSATGIAVRDSALYVAALGEIRTFTLPDLRSGPLYRVPGEHRSLTLVPDSTRVLLGSAEGVLEVDLADTPDREGLPARGFLRTPAPVLGVATRNGEALVRLAEAEAPAMARTDPPAPAATEREAQPDAASRAEPEPAVAPEPEPEAVPEPVPEPPIAPETETESEPENAVAPETEPEAEPETEVVPEPKTDAEPGVAPETEPGTESASESDAPTRATTADRGTASPPEDDALDGDAPEEATEPQAPVAVFGKIDNAPDDVEFWIVAYGPDDLLGEAARVRPDDDGTWKFRGLAPGKYRIAVEAGGASVVQTSPPFLVVPVTDRAADAGVLEIRTVR